MVTGWVVLFYVVHVCWMLVFGEWFVYPRCFRKCLILLYKKLQSSVAKPAITIEYCPKCGWMLRAAYMAQEILTTFNDDIHSVTLQPSETGGAFFIYIDGKILFDRKEAGQFPEIKILKQIIRDRVNPGKSLGHADRNSSSENR